MKVNISIILSIILTLFTGNVSFGQGIRGSITDTNNQVIPFSTIYIKELKRGTTSNINGEFEIKLPKGDYTIIISNLGFKPVTKKVQVKEKFALLNIILEEQVYLIKEVSISSKAEDPAYAIMRKAIGLAPFYLNQVNHYLAEVYLKGSINLKKIPKIFKKAMEKEENNIRVGVTYVEESLSEIQFNAPDKYDQKVISFKTSFPEYANMNPMGYIKSSLYQPTIDMAISPLAPNAFTHYKFRYEGATLENEYVINKIKVTPRRKSQQLFSGYLYIVDDLWNIHSADLTQVTFVGPYRIKQIYSPVEEFVWLPVSHNIEIDASIIGIKINVKFAGSVKYSDITINEQLKQSVAFKEIEEKYTDTTKYQILKEEEQSKSTRKIEKILNKEEMTTRDMIKLARLSKHESEKLEKKEEESLEITETTSYDIEEDADKKDTVYWNNLRPIPLTVDEINGYRINDSIKLAKTGRTIEADTTKKTEKKGKKLFGKILGGSRFYLKDSTIRLQYDGLLNPKNIDFNTVDGWSYYQYFSLTKNFNRGKFYRLEPTAGYAFDRKTFLWGIENQFRYAPLKRARIILEFGKGTRDFNKYYGINRALNAIASLCLRDNYLKLFEHTYFNLENQIDITNGLQFNARVDYSDRVHLENTTNFSFFFRETKDYSLNIPDNSLLAEYPLIDQKSFSFTLNLNYTPRYYYRIRKGVKYMEHSGYPTFSLTYSKGIKGFFDSSSDFDYLEFGVNHTMDIGVLSELSWNLKAGGFLNNNYIHFADFKHFNTQEIPVLLDRPHHAFMLLGYYKYSTTEWFTEAHIKYNTPFLIIKLLPYFSERLWRESLYCSYLCLPEFKNYIELGYGLTDFYFVADVSVFVGFEEWKYGRWGLKVSLNF
jgi:hypothetical protein